MKKTLSISNIIQKNSAILHSDGLIFKKAIQKELKDSEQVMIDFTGLEFCTTAFLNAAIGSLLLKQPDLYNKLDFIYADDNPMIKIKVSEMLDLVQNELKRDNQDSIFRNYQFS